MSAAPVEGHCDPRFAGVRAAFEANFASRGDVGASVAITVGGEPVVDLWGGWADRERTRPWARDDIANVYSTTKGMLALSMHLLADRGMLDLDAPVARSWPEFAQAGKEEIPVRWILSHRAGLPAVSEPVPDDALYDWERMVGAIERQRPWWEPGTDQGYHAATFGWLNGEVLRRVTGRRFVDFFREEVAGPLDLDFQIAFGPEVDPRVAEMIPPLPAPGGAPSALEQRLADPSSMAGRAFGNPPRPPGVANTRRWRAAEIPSSNGHTNARALARLYGVLACGGAHGGRTLISPEAIARAAALEVRGPDAVLGMETSRSLGFMLPIAEQGDPRGPAAFGHAGMGGSVGFADPEQRMGFGYVMNQMGPAVDVRWRSLARAAYAALG